MGRGRVQHYSAPTAPPLLKTLDPVLPRRVDLEDIDDKHDTRQVSRRLWANVTPAVIPVEQAMSGSVHTYTASATKTVADKALFRRKNDISEYSNDLFRPGNQTRKGL
jgi:hypothetical protein